jgi:spore coat protein CotH
LREVIVEAFLLASDNLEDGQNYYAYQRTSDSRFQMIEFDFDECFALDTNMDRNVFQFNSRNIMVKRLLLDCII